MCFSYISEELLKYVTLAILTHFKVHVASLIKHTSTTRKLCLCPFADIFDQRTKDTNILQRLTYRKV